MGLAGSAVADQQNIFPLLDELPVGEFADQRLVDRGLGVKAKAVEGFNDGEAGGLESAVFSIRLLLSAALASASASADFTCFISAVFSIYRILMPPMREEIRRFWNGLSAKSDQLSSEEMLTELDFYGV